MKNAEISKKGLFMLMTAMLVLFTSATVQSQEGELIVDEAGMRAMEREYVQEIRTYLESQGYENSGVNLTYVTEEDGQRSYMVLIHHKRISKLSEDKKQSLFSEVEEMAFQVSGVEVCINRLK